MSRGVVPYRMVRAYVMIRAGTGAVDTVVEAVRATPHVAAAHVVAGDYDVIAEVETGEMYDVMETVANELHGVDGVETTKTYVCID